MTEEIETTQTETAGEQTASIDQDPRFEVKWRKKESSAPRPQAETSPDATGAEDAADLRRQLEEAQQRIQDLQDRWHRAQADLANLRKRTEQEKGDVERFASMALVFELLPVLDNFERALATIPGNLALLTWIQGTMLIERHLRAILEHQGLAEIEAQGQFNPYLHEAISEQETESVPAGHIVQVYQKGYTMHGRVIRPALVEVAKTPEKPATEPEPEPTTTTDDAEAVAEETTTENTGP